MKFISTFLAIAILLACSDPNNSPISTTKEKLTDLVNPLMGTDSDFSLSTGNTYPAIARPWGMNFWTPQTGKMGNGWGYTYDATKIRGIKQSLDMETLSRRFYSDF